MENKLFAVLFALASALTIAWGTVVRHRIAEKAPADGTWSGSPVITAIRRPLWWFATSTALLGYFFQVLALGYGTLLTVQPILALSLLFTMPMSAIYDKRRLLADELIWGAILSFAVATVIILGKPTGGHSQPSLMMWLVSLTVGTVIMAALFAISYRFSRDTRGLLLGVAVGINYGFVAVLSKAVVDIYRDLGLSGLLISWDLYLLIGGAIIGTILQQYAFNAGALQRSLPAMTSVEPLVAFGLGYLILGEKFDVHGYNWFIMCIALVAMVLSTFALSTRGNH